VFDPGKTAGSSPDLRAPAPAAPGPRKSGLGGNGVWFRLNVGRQKNADPRWLLPLICRQGKITRQEIGAIRIFERETKFEIDAEAAGRFYAAIRKLDEPDIHIEPLAEHAQDGHPSRERGAAKSAHGPKGRFAGKPFAKAHGKAKSSGKSRP